MMIYGKWNSTLLRKVINVMDKHKISNKAYHELKMTLTSGFNPPMNQIKDEKKVMSQEIPFTKHPSVSLRNFALMFHFVELFN